MAEHPRTRRPDAAGAFLPVLVLAVLAGGCTMGAPVDRGDAAESREPSAEPQEPPAGPQEPETQPQEPPEPPAETPAPRPAAGRSPFGAHLSVWEIGVQGKAGAVPGLMSQVRDLGVGSVRVDVIWQRVEPARGDYDWALLDRILEASPPGLDFLFTVYSSSTWAGRESRGSMLGGLPRPSLPRRMEDYQAFLRKLVGRYRERVRYWQIENEVYGGGDFWNGGAEEYLTLLHAAAQAIRGVDPEARILAAGIALADLDTDDPAETGAPKVRAALSFLEAVVERGRDDFDVVDLHLYWKWQAMPGRIAFVGRRLAKHGARKPIWITELGGPDLRAFLTRQEFDAIRSELGPRTRTGEARKLAILRDNEKARITYFSEHAADRHRLQAAELVKRFLVALGSGVERVFWHKLRVEGEDLFWNRMALADRDGKRFPAFRTYRGLVERLSGFESITRRDLGPDVYVYEIRVPKGRVFVGWAERPTEIQVPGSGRTVVDATGRRSTIGPDGSLRLTEMPVFVD